MKRVFATIALLGLLFAAASAGAQPNSTPTPSAVKKPARQVQADEQKALQLLNQDRARHGLPALKADSGLCVVARAHARDMVARRFFDHTNPEGKSPFDRMHDARIPFGAAGENIALNSSIAGAHRSWMKSPGHRANILSKDFTRVGIGVAHDRKGRLYAVQLFADG